jgi:hypothetical protein
MTFEKFVEHAISALRAQGVTDPVIYEYIASIERELREMYETTEIERLDEALYKIRRHFITEYIPTHLVVIPALALTGRGVDVRHTRPIWWGNRMVRPTIRASKANHG